MPVIGEQEPLVGFLDHLLAKIHSVQRIGACHVLESILSSLMAGSNFTILTFTGIRALPEMGFIQPNRIQVRLLKPDLALALTW